MPNWAEQVTAIATAVSAIGLLSAIGAVIFAGQQAREARIGRQAEMAVEFFRRWSEGPMLETRRLVAQFETPEALRDALTVFVAENSAEAYILYRELAYFEQLGALERHGGFDFELIRTLLGRRLIDRWEMWQPAIDAIGGSAAYPMLGPHHPLRRRSPPVPGHRQCGWSVRALPLAGQLSGPPGWTICPCTFSA